MAANATHVGSGMSRAVKDDVLACVAFQADVAYLSRRGGRRVEDF